MSHPSSATAEQAESTAQSRDWRDVYASRLLLTDLLAVIWVVFGVQLLWFGFETADAAFTGDRTHLAINYTAISLGLVVAWMLALQAFGTRGFRIIGTGSTEYALIARASMQLFGLVAIIAFLIKLDLARGYILLAFPIGIVVLCFTRWLWRQWLIVQRSKGRYSTKVLLVGSELTATHIARELTRFPAAGYRVVGACVPSGSRHLAGTNVPVLGPISSAMESLETSGADTVAITSSEELTPRGIKELSWQLEPGRQHLVVAPGLTDIGGPRIHTRPVAGLPLIHVEIPRYEGRKQFTKRAFDLAGSSLLIVLLSPVLAAIAVGVRLSSPGPVLFRQPRIGLNGSVFNLLKFRSMVANAEERLGELQGLDRAEGNRVLFKMKDDPRVTPLGRILRRFSLDELPQLLNVFAGSMSLVGPRPPLEREVQLYEDSMHRRFLVKPGITGLWQVNGRSNLSWEDSVRLDLYYVENWSITGDLVILWRTVKAVLDPDGAY